MPLGASRVEGKHPRYESFRYPLWKMLKENGWTFDLIGTQLDRASYPRLGKETFDNDHEGRNGYTSRQIMEGLPSWLEKAGTPDVVLVSAPGGNDVLRLNTSVKDIVSNYSNIIDQLQEKNPAVKIVIEKIAPARLSFMDERMTVAFQALHERVGELARKKTSSKSVVVAIDMHTGFSDDMLADEVHYNQKGAEFIATRYYQVLSGMLEK